MTDEIWDAIDPFGHGPMHFDKAGNPISMRQWSELREQGSGNDVELSDYARIGLQYFEGSVRVSTVWLGIDHSFGRGPPLIFETMIFSGNERYPYDEATMRYSTEQEAVEGHRRTCEDVEHGRRPWFLDTEEDL